MASLVAAFRHRPTANNWETQFLYFFSQLNWKESGKESGKESPKVPRNGRFSNRALPAANLCKLPLTRLRFPKMWNWNFVEETATHILALLNVKLWNIIELIWSILASYWLIMNNKSSRLPIEVKWLVWIILSVRRSTHLHIQSDGFEYFDQWTAFAYWTLRRLLTII